MREIPGSVPGDSNSSAPLLEAWELRWEREWMWGMEKAVWRCCQQELSLLRDEVGFSATCTGGARGINILRSHFLSSVFHLVSRGQGNLLMFTCIAEWRRVMESGVHLPNSMDLAFSSLLLFSPLVFSPLLVIVASIFKYLIHEHCGLSVWPLHLQNLFFSIIPLLTSIVKLIWSWLLPCFHWDLQTRGTSHFSLFILVLMSMFPTVPSWDFLVYHLDHPWLLCSSLTVWFWEDLILVNAIQLSPLCLPLSCWTFLEKTYNWANWSHIKIRATNLKWALIYLVFLLHFCTGEMLSFPSGDFTL